MCAVQLLRVSVHERISAAAEDFLLQVETGEEAAEIPALRALLTERLTAAAEEIVGLFEETVAEYEDRVERSEREICRQRRLLDAVLKPEVKLHRTVFPADVQQLLVSKEEVPNEQQEWSPLLDQKDPPEPPHIKEEEEELWSSQEGEQLQGLEEADITKFTFTPVPVKTEEDDEEKPQSSQLHQTQTEAGGEDCGGPEPAGNSDPERHLQPDTDDRISEFSVAEIEVSCEDWEETREPQSGFSSLKHNEDPKSKKKCNSLNKVFSCSDCGKKFTKHGFLETHMRMHTGGKPFSCSVCGKQYTIYRYLVQHMAVHDGDKRHSCRICNKRHAEVEYVKCDKSECNKRLCYSHHLKKDMGAHIQENLFSCSVCGRKFTQRGYLIQHMARHTGEKRFRCCVCDKKFAWRHELKSHKCFDDSSQLHQSQTEENREAEPLTSGSTEQMEKRADEEEGGGSDSDDTTSDSCEPETEIIADDRKAARELEAGLNSATNNKVSVSDAGNSTDRKTSSCSECGRILLGEENLKIHMRVCAGEKPFNFCEEGFAQKECLTNHAAVNTEKRFLYCVCGKRFAWRSNLRNHKCVGEASQLHQSQTEVSREAELPASISKGPDSSQIQSEVSAAECNETRSLKNNEILEGDTRSDPAERPFSCSLCGKRFGRKKNLQEHTRIHTGEKPYGCSVCMKYFSCSGSLRKHLRIHTGEKPFSCSVCGNRFTESGHLKVHMRTHTGEKPFSCSVCGISFTWRQSFKNHMKYHTETTREMN